MLIDLNRCTGCQSCTIACKAESGAARGVLNTRVLVYDTNADGRIKFLPTLCNHCDTPACLPACPETAIAKREDGIVTIDWALCVGEGACVQACPYDACHIDTVNVKADKCDFCLDRLQAGRPPACVESCASKARLFGNVFDPEDAVTVALKKYKYTVRNGLPAGRVFYIPRSEVKGGANV